MKPKAFVTRKPSRPELGINELALEMARKFHAIDDQGNLWCILCNRHPGILPSLTCVPCLAEWRRKHG